MEVGAGPGIGDAGDLGQGPEHGGTESESGGMIGTVDGPGMDDAVSIDAFEAALSKALGLERETTMNEIDAMMDARERERGRQAMSAEIEAMMGARETGVDEATAASVRSTMEAMGMLDDETDTSPADFREQENRSRPAMSPMMGFDPEKESFRAEEEARMGSTLEAIGREPGLGTISATLDDDPWGGTKEQKEHKAHALAFVNEVDKRYKEIMETTKPWSQERNRALRELNAIRDTGLYSKAYNVSNPSAVRNMLAKAMGYLGMGHAFSIAQALENKAIERGLFDRTTFDQMMKEFDDPAAFGAAGNPLGTGGSEQRQRDIINELFYQVNPWARGLNKRQIDYYLDRPSELEWVQNLYSQMNPSGGMGQ